MYIESIKVAFPSRIVTNEDILTEVDKASKMDDKPKALRLIRSLLKRSGSHTRHWCGAEETSLGVTLQACNAAMKEAGGEIDLVISASVYPELHEPATANLLAHEVGLTRAKSFDLKEACDGWMRAMEVAQLYLKAGAAKRVLVVNGEFVMRPGFGIYPNLFALSSMKQLDYRFPAFTLGEAATATIVTADGDDWRMTNTTRNELYDRCTITVPWQEKPHVASARVGKNGPGCFTSFGGDLHTLGYPFVEQALIDSGVRPSDVNAFFTHSSSWQEWSAFAKKHGYGDQFHDIYRTRGNCVSAAVPAAMAVAVEKGTLKRGHQVFALVGSAGMSFSTANFKF